MISLDETGVSDQVLIRSTNPADGALNAELKGAGVAEVNIAVAAGKSVMNKE